jgi:hypothetical protein
MLLALLLCVLAAVRLGAGAGAGAGSKLRAQLSGALSDAASINLVHDEVDGARGGMHGWGGSMNNFEVYLEGNGKMVGVSGTGCQYDNNKLHYSKYVNSAEIQKCEGAQLYWDNELYCTCWFGVEQPGLSYFFRWYCTSNGQPNGECFKWGFNYGNDGAGYMAPCQMNGCYNHMEDMHIPLSKGSKGSSEAGNPIVSIKGFWTQVASYEQKYTTKVTEESSSSDSRDTDTSISATASVGYGPSSVSSTFSSSVKTSAATSLSRASENTSEYTLKECGDDGYRWNYRYRFTRKDGSHLQQQTDIVLCARQSPLCPADFCGSKADQKADCSCCSADVYSNAPRC